MFDTCSFKPTNDGFPPSSGGGGGAVTSVFGRTGVVIAVAGDYNSTQITNSSGVTGAFVTDALNTLDTGKLSTTLTNGNIIVGNGSNVATAVAMSGDATIINTGALTISNQAVTFAKMQHISSQHLVGRHAAGTGDIQQISLGTGLSFSGSNLQVTGFLPTTLTSANIIVGNNLGVATAVAMSGDTTISNTGAVTISNDAVTTAKILNSNVTYAKIQNVAATRLLGNSTGSPAAPEEITLGTNLSFTGTTLNAAGGGGYTVLNFTFSLATYTWAKADFGGANYVNASITTPASQLTISNTGFVSGDSFILNIQTNSAVSTAQNTLSIITTTLTINAVTSISYLFVYDGSKWWVQPQVRNNENSAFGFGGLNLGYDNSTNPGQATQIVIGRQLRTISTSAMAIGFSTNTSKTTVEGIFIGSTGQSTLGNSESVLIGRNFGSSNGNNVVAVGSSISTSNSSGVTAIGQSIIVTSGSTDTVIIGRAATGNALGNVTIGALSTGTGANCVRIGNSVTTGTNTGVVAIGQGITTTNTDAVVIGRAASAGGAANVTIGATSTGTGNNCVRIGASITTSIRTGIIALGNNIQVPNHNDNIVIGNSNLIQNSNNVIISTNTNVIASNSTGIGWNININKTRQFAKGSYAYPLHYGAESRRLDSNNDSTDVTNPSRHAENTSWNVQTADATPTIMTLFGVAGERLTLQDNEALHFDVYITAKQNGSTNTLIRRIAGGAVRGAGVGSTSIVGQTQLYTHGTALTTTLTADTTNGAVQLEVTGNASTWQWTAYVEYQRTRTA